jgi:low affinity Fe/Cu permease
LIAVNRRARNSLLNLEDLTSEELEQLRDRFRTMAVKGDPASRVDADLVEGEQAERKEKRAG